MLGLIASAGCGGRNGIDIEVVPPEELADIAEMVEFENDRGEELHGMLVLPEASAPMPAVVVLHGSGGLLSPDDGVYEMSPQFEEWAGMLAASGYASILPSSFTSRGFEEWDDAPDSLDKEDRLVMRVYDTFAALEYACDHPAIDCDRLAVVGFSNGGSTAVLSAYERLDEIAGMEDLKPAARRPVIRQIVAYYPGCGLQGFVSLSMDDPAEYYFPSVPVLVQHAERDSLLDDCEDRLEQTQITARSLGLSSNPFRLVVYEDAGHGFDGDPSGGAEREARDEARALALELFAAAFE